MLHRLTIIISLIAVFLPCSSMDGQSGDAASEIASHPLNPPSSSPWSSPHHHAMMSQSFCAMSTPGSTPPRHSHRAMFERNRSHLQLHLHWFLESPAQTSNGRFRTSPTNVVTVIMSPKALSQQTPHTWRRCARPSGLFRPPPEEADQEELECEQEEARGPTYGGHRRRACHEHSNIFIALKPLKNAKSTAPERSTPCGASRANRPPLASTFLQASQDLRIGGRGT